MVTQRGRRPSTSGPSKSDPRPTRLQDSYTVGGVEVAPFVTVQEVLDHVTFLHQIYTHTRRMSPDQYRKFCRLSATDYQTWAQRCLPARERSIARERRRASRQSATSEPPVSFPAPAGEAMSRTSSQGSTARSSVNTAYEHMPATPPDTPLDPVSKVERTDPEALTAVASNDSAPVVSVQDITLPESVPSRPTASQTSSRSSFEQHYDRYVGPLTPLSKHELPPLGVLMCWHAHMSSPQNYEQECEGAYRTLRGWRFPVHQAAEAIREGLLPRKLHVPKDYFKGSLQSTNWDPYTIAIATEREHASILNLAHRTAWFVPKHASVGATPEARAVEATEKYLRFLDLYRTTLTRRPRVYLAPTPDIDLLWHTHQLHGQDYRLDVEGVLGKALDHDEHMKLIRNDFGQDWLGRTSKLWWATYREVYSSETKDPRPIWRRIMEK